jgi:hypothetical protein
MLGIPRATILAGCLVLAACNSANQGSIFRTFSIANDSVSIDANQRAILGSTVVGLDGTPRTIYCAEPSPDAFSSISSSIGGSIAGRIAGEGDVAVRLAQALATTASDALSTRNATIQLLRDGLYRACEAHAAGALSDIEYVGVVGQYQNMMLALLSIELLTTINQPRRPAVIVGGSADSGAGVEPDHSAASAAAGGNAPAQEEDQANAPGGVEASEQGEVAANEPASAEAVGGAMPGTQANLSFTPLSDASIKVIAETARILVQGVLNAGSEKALEPRIVQCLRLAQKDNFAGPPARLCEQILANALKSEVNATTTAIAPLIGRTRNLTNQLLFIGQEHMGMLPEDQPVFFTFEVTTTGSYVITANATLSSGVDPFLLLTDGDGSDLASDDDSGGELNAKIEETLAAGQYEIAVVDLQGNGGQFRLLITLNEPETND